MIRSRSVRRPKWTPAILFAFVVATAGSGLGQDIQFAADEWIGTSGDELVVTAAISSAVEKAGRLAWQLDAYGAPVQRGEFAVRLVAGARIERKITLQMPPVKAGLVAPLTLSAGFVGDAVSAEVDLWVCQTEQLAEAGKHNLVLYSADPKGALAAWSELERTRNPAALPTDRPWLVDGETALVEPALRHAAAGGRAALVNLTDGTLAWPTLNATAPDRVQFSRRWFAERKKHFRPPVRPSKPITAGPFIGFGGDAADTSAPFVALEISWKNGGQLLVLAHALPDTATGQLQLQELSDWLAPITKETP